MAPPSECPVSVNHLGARASSHRVIAGRNDSQPVQKPRCRDGSSRNLQSTSTSEPIRLAIRERAAEGDYGSVALHFAERGQLGRGVGEVFDLLNGSIADDGFL